MHLAFTPPFCLTKSPCIHFKIHYSLQKVFRITFSCSDTAKQLAFISRYWQLPCNHSPDSAFATKATRWILVSNGVFLYIQHALAEKSNTKLWSISRIHNLTGNTYSVLNYLWPVGTLSFTCPSSAVGSSQPILGTRSVHKNYIV